MRAGQTTDTYDLRLLQRVRDLFIEALIRRHPIVLTGTL
jgi:hypothetical protein